MTDQAIAPDYQQEAARLRTELLQWVVGQLSIEIDSKGITSLPKHLRDAVDAQAAQTLSAATESVTQRLNAIPLPDTRAFRQDILATLTAEDGTFSKSLQGLEQRIGQMEASIAQQSELLNLIANKVNLPPVGPASTETPVTDEESEYARACESEETGPPLTASGTELRKGLNGNENEAEDIENPSFWARAKSRLSHHSGLLFGVIVTLLLAAFIYFLWETLNRAPREQTTEPSQEVSQPATADPTEEYPPRDMPTTEATLSADTGTDTVPAAAPAVRNRQPQAVTPTRRAPAAPAATSPRVAEPTVSAPPSATPLTAPADKTT